MNRWLVRGILLAALLGLGFWGWKKFFPSPEQIIRKRLAEVAETASFATGEAPLVVLAGAQRLGGFFAGDVEIVVDVPGRDQATFTGREEVIQAAVGARSAVRSLRVDFVDVSVSLAPDEAHATTQLTARATINQEKDAFVQELKISWTKFEGRWLISRIETVKTLA